MFRVCGSYIIAILILYIGEFLSYFIGIQGINDGRNQEQPYDDQHDRNKREDFTNQEEF